MARKKAHRRKTTHHRRRHSRVSGIGNMGMQVAGVVLGAVAAKFIGKAIEGKVNAKIVAGGQILAGVFIPKFIKGTFGESVGNGFIATGGTGLLTEFGVLKGIGAFGDDDTLQMEYISGFDDHAALPSLSGGGREYSMPMSGVGDLPSLAGIGDDDEDQY